MGEPEPVYPGEADAFRPDPPDVDPFPQPDNWRARPTLWTGAPRKLERLSEEEERRARLAADREDRSARPQIPVEPPSVRS